MHKLRTFGIIALGAMFAAAFATKASAADKPWWPFPTEDWSSGEARSIEYTPLEKASKKWHICVLFPHLKDSWWVAAGYGIAEEAKRQGVQMTLLQAGGYTELNKQISQYDDCVAYGVDAIVMGVVSESGMSRKIEEGREKGIVQVTMANPVIDAPVHAKIFADVWDRISAGAMFGPHSEPPYQRASGRSPPRLEHWRSQGPQDSRRPRRNGPFASSPKAAGLRPDGPRRARKRQGFQRPVLQAGGSQREPTSLQVDCVALVLRT